MASFRWSSTRSVTSEAAAAAFRRAVTRRRAGSSAARPVPAVSAVSRRRACTRRRARLAAMAAVASALKAVVVRAIGLFRSAATRSAVWLRRLTRRCARLTAAPSDLSCGRRLRMPPPCPTLRQLHHPPRLQQANAGRCRTAAVLFLTARFAPHPPRPLLSRTASAVRVIANERQPAAMASSTLVRSATTAVRAAATVCSLHRLRARHRVIVV